MAWAAGMVRSGSGGDFGVTNVRRKRVVEKVGSRRKVLGMRALRSRCGREWVKDKGIC